MNYKVISLLILFSTSLIAQDKMKQRVFESEGVKTASYGIGSLLTAWAGVGCLMNLKSLCQNRKMIREIELPNGDIVMVSIPTTRPFWCTVDKRYQYDAATENAGKFSAIAMAAAANFYIAYILGQRVQTSVERKSAEKKTEQAS